MAYTAEQLAARRKSRNCGVVERGPDAALSIFVGSNWVQNTRPPRGTIAAISACAAAVFVQRGLIFCG
uniref:Uncharacterized protein n=1 Tax=Mycena chlorophos TaxID=658473 RepID=A0ABQ0M1U1_MYCCL|nr:predicted protein [Mycena chlorophos]